MNAFEQAVDAHEEWRTAFERVIREGGHGLQVDLVSADNRCLLGMWLDRVGRDAVLGPTAVKMLRDIHAEFHAAAAAVLAAAQAGRIREAVHAMSNDAQGQYALWSATLLHALSRYSETEPGPRVEPSGSTTA